VTIAPRATKLRLAGRTLELDPGHPLVMGIVNATPDSFSDRGRFPDLHARARELLDAGADIVEVGGESGVTDSPPVNAAEEIDRVVPVIERLSAEEVAVSVDTWKGEVARAALAAGAAMVNDVSGLRDPSVADACAEAGAALVITHTRAAPKQKLFPAYHDVRADVLAFLRERMSVAIGRGVGEEQIVLDPGPDLAKTPAETIDVLRDLRTFAELGRPLLLSVSRKDFVGALTGRRPSGRLAGTLAALAAGLEQGAAILRVHDVAEANDFLTVRAALREGGEVSRDLRLADDLRRESAA
jgi:dihydropteroate synthase